MAVLENAKKLSIIGHARREQLFQRPFDVGAGQNSYGPAGGSVVDDKKTILRCHGLGALLAGWMREVQIGRERSAFPVGDLKRALRHWDTS